MATSAVIAKNRPPTLLYVEDDIATAKVFETMLATENRQVKLVVVPDGDEALAALGQKGEYADMPMPDLIVLDLNLPRMNGFTVFDEIRKRNLSGAPVVIFTSSRLKSDQRRAADLGATAFILKTADFDEFCRAIDQIYNLLIHAAQNDTAGPSIASRLT